MIDYDNQEIQRIIDLIDKKIQPLIDAINKELDKIEQVAAARLGRRPTYDDWDGPELQDLAGQRNDLRDRTSSPREPDYSPEELAIYQKEQLLEKVVLMMYQ